MTTLLIDGDIVAFQAYESVGQDLVRMKLNKILKDTGAEDFKFYLTGSENYRKDVLPSYKGNRADTRKPLILKPLKDWMIEVYKAVLREPFEADDLMGIRGSDGNDTIIVSEDKDLKTIPCRFFNPAHPEDGIITISESDADLMFLTQVLTGDAVDNYKGCPKIGPVKAQQILTKATLNISDSYQRVIAMWQAIVTTYEKAGLTEDDAIIQARCARILRYEDIDNEGEIILWTPPVP